MSTHRVILLLACLWAIVMAHPALARVIRVPEDQPNVLAAVEHAQSGDEIDVASGRWKGGIDLQGKALVLRGRAGGHTVLVGNDVAGPVIVCDSGERQGTVLQNLVIRSGSGRSIPGYPALTIGGGMLCLGGAPTVRDCTFEGNVTTHSGGAVYLGQGADAHFEQCIFRNNQSDKGGGVFCVGSEPVFTDCVFEGNRAAFAGGGLYAADDSAATVTSGRFVRNIAGFTGGGVYEYDAKTRVTDATFDRNRATLRGGAAFLGHQSRGVFERCHYLSPTDELAGSRLSLHRPPVRGACMLDRWCVQAQETDCMLAGGVYLGDHVSCSEQTVDAGKKRAGDVDLDGEVDDRDIALLMLLWR